ncbi:MAG: site-specific DNA-methyltransferase [Pseudomonadota bacterium]
MTQTIVQTDATEFLRAQPEGSLDLVFGSPPYEEARLYLEGGQNLGISRKTDAWVKWLVEWWSAAQAACKGLVALVVAGQTRSYRWSAGPVLLMAELHRAGFNLRNPPIYHRAGIPGSGGPDWLKSCYEFVVCTSRPGPLPWSDNTALGHKPICKAGGAVSYRQLDGTRVNEKPTMQKSVLSGYKDGDTTHRKSQSVVPDLANPGNVIYLPSGGGLMGSELAHENEAPFPERLAEFFVLSFAPPGGTVCDPFSGSGTTATVCKRHGRNFVGCDLRQSQVDLGLKRLAQETPPLFV